jgi:hypothetical protein
MTATAVFLPLLLSGLLSCKRINKPENPIQVARLYCDCLADKFRAAKDSLVNINECNGEFAKSRLMNIHLGDEPNAFSQAILDSADNFLTKLAISLIPCA